MLGGSVYLAAIRFVISLGGTILLFCQLSESRFGRKKTLFAYLCLMAAAVSGACAWYVLDWESCVRLAPFTMYFSFCCLGIYLGSDPVYLSLYKLALTFYMMAVFLVGGLEISIIFFDRNVWADIIIRILLIFGMWLFIEKKIKGVIRGFGRYVESELDTFSINVMIISILLGIGFILNPNVQDQTPYRLFQLVVNFFLTGVMQALTFRLYLHTGREREYQKENQLMKMGQRLLERQMELLEESVESGRRIRHDVRHHNAVIAEYARRGQNQEMLEYLAEYDRETEEGIGDAVCANSAVNNIILAYTRWAGKERIKVLLDVGHCGDLSIPNIDLVTILANAYENAIYGCIEARKHNPGQECVIHLTIKKKKNKLAIHCSNTCGRDVEIQNGRPKPEATGGIGVLSIIKTAEKYGGEYDFKNNDGTFVFRMVLNLPSCAGSE